MKKLMLVMVVLGFVHICQAVSITTTNDAEIRSDDPDSTFGSKNMLTGHHTVSPDIVWKSYVQFDASSLVAGEVVTNVELTMYFTGAKNRQGTFYLITGSDANNWDEFAITWNNAPGNDKSKLGNKMSTFLNNEKYTNTLIGYSALGQGEVGFLWEAGAKDSVISALNSGDRKVTIGLVRPGVTGDAQFASHELADSKSTYSAMKLEVQTVTPSP